MSAKPSVGDAQFHSFHPVLSDDPAVERTAARVRDLLARPGAWIGAARGGYQLRADADRRRRPLLSFEEPVFRRLAADGALRPIDGGWALSRTAAAGEGPSLAGRPGVIEGERVVQDPAAGTFQPRRANLGETPIAWLARRRDADGRPLLSAVEVAAATRLRDDLDRCGVVGRLTADLGALPRGYSKGAAYRGLDPAERSLWAKARVAEALDAAGPGLREVLERVCLQDTALEAAERTLNLPRRTGKTLLKLALQRLAAHYGLK